MVTGRGGARAGGGVALVGRAPGPGAGRRGAHARLGHVTESARARSYYSISTGTQIGDPSAVPFLTPRVKKCLIHVL